MLLLLVTASAAKNAWTRFLAPWKETPRYTFAAIKPLPDRLVVPHGERFDVSIGLQESTEWKPSTAEVRLSGQPPKRAPLADREYHFELPGQITPAQLDVRVGDYNGEMTLRADVAARAEFDQRGDCVA